MDWVRPESCRAVPKLVSHCRASLTLGTSSVPPASSSSTEARPLSARRRATTEPDEPDPQNNKIIGWLKLCREPALIGFNASVEFHCSQFVGGIASWVRFQVNYSGTFQ